MGSRWIMVGAMLGFLAVGAGAFGAHGLRRVLSETDLGIYQTAVTYQFYHALALVLYGLWMRQHAAAPGWPAVAFVLGVAVFSGSLYLLVLSGVRSWGMVTPIGGVAFLAGWAGFAWSAWRARG